MEVLSSTLSVLYLSAWFPCPPDNGSKIRVYHLLRALGGRHDVTLLSFAFGTAQPALSQAEGPARAGALSAWCSRVRTVACDPLQRGRLARALRFLSPRPIVAAPIEDMARLARDTLRDNRFDALIASTMTMAPYVPRRAGTPCVLEEHNSLSRWMWERYLAQRSPLQRLRCWASWQKTRAYEARLYRRFDLCTVVSEQDRRACRAMLPGCPETVEVVPNGVDCAHNRPGLAPKRPGTLVYNGALTYGANYDAMQFFLAEVYPHVRRQVPEVSLTISGPLDGVDLAGLALDDSVHLSGHVDDVRPLVAGSEVCVVPIRQGGGTRLKILEAMALGTPVISTSKGAEGLKAIDGQHLWLADDAQHLARHTVALLRDRGARDRLAGNARRLVEECYDWVRIGAHFVRLVEELVDGRRTGCRHR